MIRWLSFFVWLCLPIYAYSSPLVGDISQYRIEMDASFNGTKLFLFGARNASGDVIIVIRGPGRNYIVRKKEPIGGIWINRGRMKLYDTPGFYAVVSNKPIESIEAEQVLKRLGLGTHNLITYSGNEAQKEKEREYSEAFIDFQQTRGLYHTSSSALQFMGETLFKAAIDFPDTIPPGAYTAELYLIEDSEIIGMQSIPIHVTKTGLDAWLYHYAHAHPFMYGLTAIILALSVGWFAGRLFERT